MWTEVCHGRKTIVVFDGSTVVIITQHFVCLPFRLKRRSHFAGTIFFERGEGGEVGEGEDGAREWEYNNCSSAGSS